MGIARFWNISLCRRHQKAEMVAAVTQTIYLCPTVTRFIHARVTVTISFFLHALVCCVWISIHFRGPKGPRMKTSPTTWVPGRMALRITNVAGVEEDGEALLGVEIFMTRNLAHLTAPQYDDAASEKRERSSRIMRRAQRREKFFENGS
ncbi:hypothetical protein MMC22_011057 [Lobaria immixta]|nr:hypothetical protein [Lobaria immixta]